MFFINGEHLVSRKRCPGEMPVEHLSAITPTEVLRWQAPRPEEANRWQQKIGSKALDSMVLEAYDTPVGHWKFFHSRSTTNTASPHAPPCGREAPKGRIDKRDYVVARSVEEGIRVLESRFCRDLDFTSNAVMSHKDVSVLQTPFRGDDAKADYGKTATTQALVVRRAGRDKERDKEQEREDAAAIIRLREVQMPAIQLLKLIATNPTIHTLRVDCKNLGEEAIAMLAASLETNTSLRFLDCSSNYMTPHAAGLLGYALRSHPLEELHLDFSNLGSSGAHHFGAAVYGNTALQVLSIRGNNIGADFPKSILFLLTPLPVSQGGGSSMKKDLDGPAVDDQGSRFQCPIKKLCIDDNPLKDFPIRLGSISANIDITIQRCRIQHPPSDIVAKGWQAIRAELRIEFEEYEHWHAQQLHQHNNALAHNPLQPPWQRASDYNGVTADDLE
mmetsp:Transcript_55006/g.89150  ORF Transcript_55006/g.89150 Transcript_55006/m.89150 type:complete len:445 (-) Transcript_55006:110-1444(-)|eukprot:CAMPEP_0179427358 /NCGR_PEP_ID=MMETSP0799-20121207/13334_1 /TAXON_ID=46947 /ORGANISM="Geminigera cryophila, Strain CCMP2564" /LENGTH=444 /DNA_ID=CAMNT_0021202381 /DNA_START=232 /DNA_END=1566 /DNA_ORIENTATION=+